MSVKTPVVKTPAVKTVKNGKNGSLNGNGNGNGSVHDNDLRAANAPTPATFVGPLTINARRNHRKNCAAFWRHYPKLKLMVFL